MADSENTAPQGEGRRRKVGILETDDAATVERKLRDFFDMFKEDEKPQPPLISSYVGPGRPRADWHLDAIEEIKTGLDQDASLKLAEAIRRVANKFNKTHNVTEHAVKDAWYSAKNEEYEEFLRLIIEGKFAAAANTWFTLETRQRQEFNTNY